MFAINKLLSKPDNSNESELYVKVSSLIEEGSVLDRRRDGTDRRLSADRRKSLGDIISGIENRLLKQRRLSSTRRDSDKDSVDVGKNINRSKLDLSHLEEHTREQLMTISRIEELSVLAKELDFDEVKNKLHMITHEIEYSVKKEKHFLHLYLVKNGKKHIKQKGKSLSELNSYILDGSEQALQFLDKYRERDVSTANVGFFLLDMSLVREKLDASLEVKKSELYSMYKSSV